MIFVNIGENNTYIKFKNMYRFKINYPATKLFLESFDELFNGMNDSDTATPAYDVVENEKEFIIEMQLPGVKRDDMEIITEKNELTIKAERKCDKDLKYNRKQMFCGKYEKSFVLPDYVDKENIDAAFVDGILVVNIPKILDDAKIGKRKVVIK